MFTQCSATPVNEYNITSIIFKYGQGIGTLFRSVKFSMPLKINKRSVTRSLKCKADSKPISSKTL